ncbi:MAG: UDP-N-acetylmuramoyl-L-alanyl-D-glutamate--2,6-diaminopimelate ligase, partial [Acidobacteriota bacterium]
MSALQAAASTGVALDALARQVGLDPVGWLGGGAPVDVGAIRVRGVAHDSRRVRPGDLFVAIVGAQHDGRRFAADAVARGAVAVLGPRPGNVAPALDVPWLIDDAPRLRMGSLAARCADHPDRALTLVGVTGTNGKSTVVALLGAMLDAAARPAGQFGTLGLRLRGAAITATDRSISADRPASADDRRTTPEADELVRGLDALRRAGADSAVMEVSSHGLVLGRVDGLRFDLAVFTQLSRDHLDFHPDLAAYFAAKTRLFRRLGARGRAVVTIDDVHGRRLAARLRESGVPLLRASIEADTGADVWPRRARLDLAGMDVELHTPRGRLSLISRLRGRFNLRNLVTAVAAAEMLRVPHAAIEKAMAVQVPVPGRLAPVIVDGDPSMRDLPIFIDYAHTPDALAAVVGDLAALSRRRLAVVFGCGGDRDAGKRAPMGAAVGARADLAIATSDNPRGEDPHAILDAVERGLRAAGAERRIGGAPPPGVRSYRRVVDRRAALADARVVAHGAAQGGPREADRWTVR